MGRGADLGQSTTGAEFPHQPAPVGADLLHGDFCAGVRVVGALAVPVLGSRHQEVAPTSAGDGLHADLERHGVDVRLAHVAENQRALDGTAQPAEPTARADEALHVLEVVVLAQKTKAPTERDVGWALLLHAYMR